MPHCCWRTGVVLCIAQGPAQSCFKQWAAQIKMGWWQQGTQRRKLAEVRLCCLNISQCCILWKTLSFPGVFFFKVCDTEITALSPASLLLCFQRWSNWYIYNKWWFALSLHLHLQSSTSVSDTKKSLSTLWAVPLSLIKDTTAVAMLYWEPHSSEFHWAWALFCLLLYHS